MFSFKLPKRLASRVMRPLALLAIAALAAPGAALADSNWTSVGSTGIVDESCYFAVQMENFEARLMPGLLVPCKVRYQLTDTYGTPGGLVPARALFAHIRDTNISPGRVTARLLAYPIAGGAPVSVAFIDSDAPGPIPPLLANGFREYRNPTTCVGAFTLNFTANSYWIEVDLIPALLPAAPGPLAIGMLQIRNC